MTALDLYKAHYQTLLKIFLIGFIVISEQILKSCLDYISIKNYLITDADYRHGNIIWKYFNNKNLDNFLKIHTITCTYIWELDIHVLKIYELDPTNFLSTPGLAWQACLKMTGIKLNLLTDVNMLLIVDKEMRGGMCHEIHIKIRHILCI